MKKLAALIVLATVFTSCVSYEPRVLVPNITFSPEDVSFVHNTTNTPAIDFGFTANVNESDSLFNVEVLPGVKVSSIEAGGPAELAGLQVGDTVLSISDVVTNHPDTVLALQQQSADKLTFKLKGRRGTVIYEANLQARKRPAASPPIELFRADPIATRAGYTTETLQIENRGGLAAARITEFFPDSPLPAAGFSIGDRIIALNGVELNSAQDLISRLNQEQPLGSEVRLSVLSENSVNDITVKLWDPGRRISRVSLGPLLNYESESTPPANKFTLLNLWLFSLYSYTHIDGEKNHSVLGLLNFSSDRGELLEE